MRLIAIVAGLFLAASTAALGQATSNDSRGGDIGLNYQWVHSNTQPGQCGCFSLTGAGLSYSRIVTPSITGVAEVNGDFAKNGPGTGNSLTLVSYLFGVRHQLPQPWMDGPHKPEPFAQALVGMAHAGGGIAGAADGKYALAAKVGLGIDVPVTYAISVRLLQVDYYLTDFPNAANEHQNNYMVSGGVVLRWSRGYGAQ